MLKRIVDRLEEGVISLLLVGMTLLVFYEVILRFVFNTGLGWIQEVTLLTSAWMVLIGASYGIKVGCHIGVDAVVRLIPSGPRRWVSIVATVLALAYCGIFIYGSWIYLSKMYLIGIHLQDVPVPRWIAHSFLLIGFVLLAFRLLQLLWAFILGKASGFRLANEVADALKDVVEDGGVAERREP
ncbi:TRAP transporter small permease [Shumkonia mesophila]|uniref:TRAP transporter small permease n=1 Tax=Shumkonia mesophila TaxID=2838854 RepID=UPI00293428C0|nr:TRAP transporter small permease [Shumkonia mesophila]